jgi:hypothetical protein
MPILGVIDSAKSGSLTSFESIATIVAAGGESSLQFTSIPQNYTHLQMRYYIRGSDAGATAFSNIYVNGFAYTTNYSGHTIESNGSTVGRASIVSGGGIGNLFSPGVTSTANVFAAGIADVLDYTNTNKNKVVRVLHGHDTSGGGQLLSTAAVTSLGIFNMTFVAGCRLSLYGIKG